MARRKYFYCRMSEQEFSAVELLAERAGVKRGEIVRSLVHQECARQKLSVGLVDYIAKNPSLAGTKKAESR